MELAFLILKSFLAFTIILSIIVFIHELGHYLMAKRCGVRVESFSIGFGKELFGWNDKSGTRWKISALPFGGYVKMFGDEDPSSSKRDKAKLESLSPKEKSQTLYYQNVRKRFIIVFAGPLFNLIFAVLVLTAHYRINGFTYFEPIVNEIMQNSPADKASVQIGDRILDINGKRIETFEQVKSTIALNPNKNLRLGLLRENRYFIANITPESQKIEDPFGNTIEAKIIGIIASTAHYEKASLPEAFFRANITVYETCANTLKALGQIIIGDRSLRELGGPVKIAKYSGQSLSKGFEAVVWFMVLISANLGLMNLLPIPMLDGGHLFFYLIEAIRKKPLSDKVQEKLFKLGFLFLVGLMIFATINDIISII